MTWLDCVGMCLWQRWAGLLVKKTNIAFFIDVQSIILLRYTGYAILDSLISFLI